MITPFIKKGIGRSEPAGLCFSTSFSLQVYLQIHHIKSTLRAGRFNDQDHFWLVLDDSDHIIIDATLRQFDPVQPEIYIGPANSNPITAEFNAYNLDLAEWFKIYDLWRAVILKSPDAISRSETFERKAILHMLSLGAAVFTALKSSHSTMTFPSSSILSLYFDPIFSGLRDIWSKKEDIITELQIVNPEFQLLIDAAKR